MAALRRQRDRYAFNDLRELSVPIGNCLFLSGFTSYGLIPGHEFSGFVQRLNSVLSKLGRVHMKKLLVLTVGLAAWLAPTPARADDDLHRIYYLRSNVAPP